MVKKEVSTHLKPIIAIIFVISGATGLMYQVAWFKYLSIFLGNSTDAQMIVLAAFLGGLALGNNFAGKKSDAMKNPLLVYSLLEFFVGLYCLCFPALVSGAGSAFIFISRSHDLIETGGVLFTLVRMAMAVVLLIVPTIAMGATLPVLSKAFIPDIRSTQRDLAILYGLNSLGAVFGVLYSGFFLIQYFGLDATTTIAACINIGIGVVGVILSIVFRAGTGENNSLPDQKEKEDTTKAPLSKLKLRIIMTIAGTSGFAALLYEMVWVRLLIQVFGSSTYAFSIMLMAFISGITIGSMIASSKLLHRLNKTNIVAFSQAAIALSTLPVLLSYDRILYLTWEVASSLQKTDTTFVFYLCFQFLLSFSTIVIPTIFMGITLPVIVSSVAEQRQAIGFSIGRVFSINTVGTVLGSLLTGLIFIPFLGMRGSFELGIFINIAAAVMLISMKSETKLFKRVAISTGLILAFLGIVFLTPAWNLKLSLASIFRQMNSTPPATFADFSKMIENRKVLYYKEGTHANVCVTEYDDSVKTRVLVINGKADASTGKDMTTQVLLGQIPMLLHDDAKEVFVVGLGSGVTVGSILTHPVNNVHCAEIATEVIHAASFFEQENNHCLEDPRLHLHIEDALTYLKLTPKKFDVIVSEPSNPWIAGIGNLFSTEYFELCKAKLGEKGIMVQWFHIYDMDNDVVRLVMNTFRSVFPNTQLWNSTDADIIMVGSAGEISLDEEKMIAKLRIPGVRENLHQVQIDNAFTFLSTQMLGNDGFYAISKCDELNTERHPLLEFRAPRSLFKGRRAGMFLDMDDRFQPMESGLYISHFIRQHKSAQEELNNAILFQFHITQVPRLVYSFASYASAADPKNYLAARYKLYAAELLPAFRIRPSFIENFPDLYKQQPAWKGLSLTDKMNEAIQAASFLGRADIDRFAGELENILPGLDSTSQTRLLFSIASAYLKNGEPEKSVRYVNKIQDILSASEKAGNGINKADFIYTAALDAAYIGNYKMSVQYVMAMLAYYPRFEYKDYMLRKVERILR